MARKKVDVDLSIYDGLSVQELKNSACRLLVDKYTLMSDKKQFTDSINTAIAEVEERLKGIVERLGPQQSKEVKTEADNLLKKSPPSVPVV